MEDELKDFINGGRKLCQELPVMEEELPAFLRYGEEYMSMFNVQDVFHNILGSDHRGHLNLMNPFEVSLHARNLLTESLIYSRYFSSILFFLQKFIEFSRMLLLLKMYFSLFWMMYLLVIKTLYQKNEPNFKFGFF